MDIPRILIAGVRSKVGKTLISIGLMRALTNRGYVVQHIRLDLILLTLAFIILQLEDIQEI